MKRTFLWTLALAASLSFISSAQASEGFDDLAKLAKSGVGEEVLIAYVQASQVQYALTVDEILYLNDIGVPNSVVAAVIRKGNPNVAAAPLPAADAPLIQPQTVPVDQVVAKQEKPAVLPPLAPDYEIAVREAVARAGGEQAPGQYQTPQVAQGQPQQPQYGVTTDPVIGRPEPIVAAQPAYQPAQPTYQTNQPKLGVSEVYEEGQQPREIVREVIVEKPVYIEKPVYVEQPVYVSSTTVVAPPPDRLNVSFFYESLSPYGSWISVDDDYYWQPSVVVTDRSWRPYWNNGNWVYTDYGWTWQSSYSWGWAPFHYGRWTNHPRHGWCWRPGTEWAPAWVHWRSNDQYTGWAPLPPEARYEAGIGFSYRGKNVSLDFHFGLGERDYGFVPVRNFCDSDFHRHGSYYRDRNYRGDYRGGDVVNIYNNTTIVNNYYRYDRDRIINNGPGYDSIRRATNKEIKQVRLTDANYRSGDPIRATRLNDDNTLQMYRPTIRRDAPEKPQEVIARREQEVQRAQAERQRQADRQAERQQANTQRNVARTQPETGRRTDTGRIEQVNQSQREQQARREAESRANQQRTEAASRERNDTAGREEQRRTQQQAEAAAREQQRRAEAAQQDAREAARKTQREDVNNREKGEAAAREEQRRAQQQAEATAREQQRRNEAAQQDARQAQRRQEAEVREQAERAQKEAQRQAEIAERQQREAARQAQQQDQQRRLDQAQREAQRNIEQAQREAQREANQQERQAAAREAAIRAQQQQEQRQSARQQEAAQRQQMAQQQELARQQAQNQQRAEEAQRQAQSRTQEPAPNRQTAREQAREEARRSK